MISVDIMAIKDEEGHIYNHCFPLSPSSAASLVKSFLPYETFYFNILAIHRENCEIATAPFFLPEAHGLTLSSLGWVGYTVSYCMLRNRGLYFTTNND